MIEFDVDMEHLAEDGELDSIVLHDENGAMDDIVYVPTKNNEDGDQDMTWTCCGNCKYWECYEAEEKIAEHGTLVEGICHRYPPSVPCFSNSWGDDERYIADLTLLLTRGTPVFDHPSAYVDDWCGEFSLSDNPLLEE